MNERQKREKGGEREGEGWGGQCAHEYMSAELEFQNSKIHVDHILSHYYHAPRRATILEITKIKEWVLHVPKRSSRWSMMRICFTELKMGGSALHIPKRLPEEICGRVCDKCRQHHGQGPFLGSDRVFPAHGDG